MKMKMELPREVTQQAKRFGNADWQYPREIVGVTNFLEKEKNHGDK